MKRNVPVDVPGPGLLLVGISLAAGLGACAAGGPPRSGSDPDAAFLRRFRSEFLAALETYRIADGPYGRYRPTPKEEPTAVSISDGVFIRYILDDLKNTTAAQRAEWAAQIRAFQNPDDGSFSTAAATPRDRLHDTGRSIRALNMLGSAPARPVRLLAVGDDPEGKGLGRWFNGLPWARAGPCATQTLHMVAPRARRWSRGELGGKAAADAFFARLEARQDPQTGLWGGDRGVPVVEGMLVTFHLTPVFEAADRPLPRVEKVIDSLLALPPDPGLGFGTMDRAYLFAYALRRSDHRKAEVRAALEAIAAHTRRMVEGGMARREGKVPADLKPGEEKIGWMGFFPDAISQWIPPCELFAEVAAALPDSDHATFAWNRAWEPELWKCEW